MPHIVLDILTWVGYINSALNPIIYAFTVDEFKQSLKQSCVALKSLPLRCWNRQTSASVEDYNKCRITAISPREMDKSVEKNGESTVPIEEVQHSDAPIIVVAEGETSNWSAKTYSVLISTKSTGL